MSVSSLSSLSFSHVPFQTEGKGKEPEVDIRGIPPLPSGPLTSKKVLTALDLSSADQSILSKVKKIIFCLKLLTLVFAITSLALVLLAPVSIILFNAPLTITLAICGSFAFMFSVIFWDVFTNCPLSVEKKLIHAEEERLKKL